MRKDLGVLPKDLYLDFITPNEDRQISAFETIADLENLECAVGVKYNSKYTSPLIRFLKNEIPVSEYFELVKDERGVVWGCVDDPEDDDCDETDSEPSHIKTTQDSTDKHQPVEDAYQLSLFDI